MDTDGNIPVAFHVFDYDKNIFKKLADKKNLTFAQWIDFYYACLYHVHDKLQVPHSFELDEKRQKLYDDLKDEAEKLRKEVEEDAEGEPADSEQEEEELEARKTKKRKTRSETSPQKTPPGSAKKKRVEFTEKEINKMTNDMLRRELRNRGKSIDGKKTELAKRLLEAIKE